MHKYIILFFLVLTLLCSCGNDDSAPDGILKKSEMVNVLADVHVVDGGLVNISQEPDTLYKYGYPRYLAVFKKYNTDSAEFRRSFKYYSLKPSVFSDIYDKVLKRLQAKTDSLTKLLTIQNKKNHVTSTPTATGGRVNSPVPTAPAQATPLRPGMMMNPSQQAIMKFNAHRDSVIKQRLKEKNALPKK
ncbi:DUF4296 domain-containing protein [Mucilaginibacter sp. L196]|uniref:DUF4296 domain-containing protein n=1 Tax=Mucilaginibacter sp. L196 TaxID=1641870 RepID=UPI00131BE2CB|nr:DUF4296 domain-containing protein [Mucilaginibacter sp. L196]